MKKIVLFLILIALILTLGAVFYNLWHSYAYLPKKNFDFIVVREDCAIQDLCFIGQKRGEAIRNLGRPDSYSVVDEGGPAERSYFYSKYNLGLDDLGTGEIDRIRIAPIDGTNIKRFRLHDGFELDYPLEIEKIFSLYGHPAETISSPAQGQIVDMIQKGVSCIAYEGSQFKLAYPSSQGFVYFTGLEGRVEKIYICRNRFWMSY